MQLRQWMFVVALALGLSGLAHAFGTLGVRQEASQLVTGTIEINAAGAVTGFTVNERERLSANVAAYLDNTVPTWRFEPVLVDGKPVAARSDMSMRLVLKPAEGNNYALSVRGIHFGMANRHDGSYAKAVRLDPPPFPRDALVKSGSAAVYLIVKVGRDGKVEDAVAEQINLLGYGARSYASSLRKEFEVASIKHARNEWKFAPPTVGDAADDAYWTVRVPVIFRVGRDAPRGGWEVYEPGPRREIPWQVPQEAPGFSPDSLPEGTHLAGEAGGLKLLSTQGGMP